MAPSAKAERRNGVLMAKARARNNSNKLPTTSRFASALAVLLAGFSIVLLQFGGDAGAQEGALKPTESGGIGFARMLAGLLVVSLATLALRHRRSNGLTERLAKLEALLEQRDDRIWALEESLVRTTKLADAQGELVVREDEAGRVTYASEMLCALVRKPLDEIVGHPILLEARAQGARVAHADGSCTFDQEIATEAGSR